MPLTSVVVTLIVVGILLWLISLIPMDATIKKIINAVVIIFIVLWLLSIFGLIPKLSTIRI